MTTSYVFMVFMKRLWKTCSVCKINRFFHRHILLHGIGKLIGFYWSTLNSSFLWSHMWFVISKLINWHWCWMSYNTIFVFIFHSVVYDNSTMIVNNRMNRACNNSDSELWHEYQQFIRLFFHYLLQMCTILSMSSTTREQIWDTVPFSSCIFYGPTGY